MTEPTLRPTPRLGVPIPLLRARKATVLDPGSAVNAKAETPRPTTYSPDSLLVPGWPGSAATEETLETIRAVAAKLGYDAQLEKPDAVLAEE